MLNILNHSNMKKFATIFCALIALVSFSFNANAGKKAKADKDTQQWMYEVETIGKDAQGNYIVKVWSFSKNSMVAEDQGKKNAVHAVVFQGLPNSTIDSSIHGIKALATSPAVEQENEEWFKAFFKNGGDYMRFVTLSNSGFSDVVKLSKSNIHGIKDWNVKYKVGITVKVNVPALRKYLEQNKVINSLSGRF